MDNYYESHFEDAEMSCIGRQFQTIGIIRPASAGKCALMHDLRHPTRSPLSLATSHVGKDGRPGGGREVFERL